MILTPKQWIGIYSLASIPFPGRPELGNAKVQMKITRASVSGISNIRQQVTAPDCLALRNPIRISRQVSIVKNEPARPVELVECSAAQPAFEEFRYGAIG